MGLPPGPRPRRHRRRRRQAAADAGSLDWLLPHPARPHGRHPFRLCRSYRHALSPILKKDPGILGRRPPPLRHLHLHRRHRQRPLGQRYPSRLPEPGRLLSKAQPLARSTIPPQFSRKARFCIDCDASLCFTQGIMIGILAWHHACASNRFRSSNDARVGHRRNPSRRQFRQTFIRPKRNCQASSGAHSRGVFHRYKKKLPIQ